MHVGFLQNNYTSSMDGTLREFGLQVKSKYSSMQGKQLLAGLFKMEEEMLRDVYAEFLGGHTLPMLILLDSYLTHTT